MAKAKTGIYLGSKHVDILENEARRRRKATGEDVRWLDVLREIIDEWAANRGR